MKTFANDNQATVFELADALKQNYNNTYGNLSTAGRNSRGNLGVINLQS